MRMLKAQELGVPHIRPSFVMHQDQQYRLFSSSCDERRYYLNAEGTSLRPDEVEDLGLDIMWG